MADRLLTTLFFKFWMPNSGIYDQEFLDYTVKALLKAKEYGFKIMIDFHQDVVSSSFLCLQVKSGMQPYYLQELNTEVFAHPLHSGQGSRVDLAHPCGHSTPQD